MFEAIGFIWETLNDVVSLWVNTEIATYTRGTTDVVFTIGDILLFLFFLVFATALVKRIVMDRFQIRDHYSKGKGDYL